MLSRTLACERPLATIFVSWLTFTLSLSLSLQFKQYRNNAQPAGNALQTNSPHSQSTTISTIPLSMGATAGGPSGPASAQAAAPSSSSSPSNASLYPWSQRRLTLTASHPSPFPRYGAAANSISSKQGDIYIMGGLVQSQTVRGDLWLVEAGGNMACYPLTTTSEAPGPRVGHAALLVGNAFIVYGGDTKIDESDVLDETLYLLNTCEFGVMWCSCSKWCTVNHTISRMPLVLVILNRCSIEPSYTHTHTHTPLTSTTATRQWSRVLPAGVRPSGRYGHSLNILGSKIFVFGGQVEGYFMNDLSAFDLNTLQVQDNRWELLIQTSGDSPAQNVPAARTNHTMITYNDKMYL